MKAEVSEHGDQSPFCCESLSEFAPALLYHAYCERGSDENFIKDFKKCASRLYRLIQSSRLPQTSIACSNMRQAYVLFHALRTQVAPLAPQLRPGEVRYLRLQLLRLRPLSRSRRAGCSCDFRSRFRWHERSRQLATILAGLPVLSSA